MSALSSIKNIVSLFLIDDICIIKAAKVCKGVTIIFDNRLIGPDFKILFEILYKK